MAPNGYNISPTGGSGVKGWFKHYSETKRKIGEANKLSLKGMKRSKESRLKQSVSTKGHKVTDETREKLRIANIGENNPMYGKEQSAETKEKRAQKLRGKKRDPKIGKKIKYALINKPKVLCPYCKNLINNAGGAYTKYHGEKCKVKHNKEA